MHIEEVFEKLKRKFPGFESRPGQLSMLQDVCAAYKEEKTLLVEAGTGTGKSLAYLIPAILWALEHKESTVISTHTIALQEQLMQKDIPFLLEALNVDLKAVLAKGMHNYVCLRRVHESEKELPETLFLWSKTAKEGSKSELNVSPSADLWDQIKAEAESCTHVRCPHYKECFFFKARKEAESAQLIVANHHLLFADLSIREQTQTSGILPPYEKLILDEAHHIEEVACEHFAKRTSRKEMLHLLNRLISDRSSGKLSLLRKKVLELSPEVKNRDFKVGQVLDKIEWTFLFEKKELLETLDSFFELLIRELPDPLRILNKDIQATFWKEKLQPKVQEFLEKGRAFFQQVAFSIEDVEHGYDSSMVSKCEGLFADIKGLLFRLEHCFETLKNFIFAEIGKTEVRWIEKGQLIAAELEIATKLSECLFKKIPTIVLCSATLATNENFSFIKKQLGIEEAQEKIYESPFDYQKQVLLSVPIDLPEPTAEEFIERSCEQIWKCIKASRGSAFVLFTSYSALQESERILSKRLAEKKYPLLCQGEESRSALLNKFRLTKHAVLFGTDSFWEGVDVVGDALRLVIIVKLPFKVPTEPLFEARAEMLTEKGESPFFHYSLPSAIVKFKQGFGRLIRNKEDRGCVVCLDPRLAKKAYGKQFLKSLPACTRLFEPSATIEQKLKDFYVYLDP